MNEYCNHSGGCLGADMAWDRIGRELGFDNHKHYRPADLKILSTDLRARLEEAVLAAAVTLQRPTSEFPGKDLVRRNWFQANAAEAIFAVSRIIPPGALDKGFVNNTGREIVAGGTAWACEMAINKGKPVHVFDMNRDNWYIWNMEKRTYEIEEIPILSVHYAGIGSRNISEKGELAIRSVYLKTKRNGTRI